MAKNQTQSEIDVPALSTRAALSSYDDESRTVDLVFSTGAPVERYDWMSGKRYIEKLSMDPKHIRLERLNSGAPLLNSHNSSDLDDQLGAVVEGSARVVKGEGVAKVRFSGRESVADIRNDVKEKIISNVSVGYRVYKFEEDAGDNKIPTRTAIDWEPFEVSMVTMPADAGAKVRKEDVKLNRCVVITRKGATVANENESEFIVEDTPQGGNRLGLAEDVNPARTATEPAEPTDADRGRDAERKRINGIDLACRASHMPRAFYNDLVAKGISLEEAQTRIFQEMTNRADPSPKVPNGAARGVMMGDDPLVHKRSGIENALLHRIKPIHFKLEDVGREYRGMSILDIAKAYIGARGIRITDMPRMEIAGVALGLTSARGGYTTTSDFPYLLADVANKSLRADYEAAPQTFEPIVKRGTVPDFRTSNRVQIGDAPALKPVGEHGEFTRGTIEEGREQVQAASYGRVFAITRQALVNDDLDAFSRVPTKFGRMAKNLESDLVWYQILKNANMFDSNALFSAAHSNYVGAGDIGVSQIGAADRAMMLQTGLDGTTLVSSQAKYLLVGPTKKMRALQFVSTTIQPATQTNVNPYAGMLSVIVEPRLEAGVTIGNLTATGSANAWYLAADKANIDIVELVFLEGQNGPVIESRVGFDIDGLEIKCRHDVGAKVLDWRGLYKSDGTETS